MKRILIACALLAACSTTYNYDPASAGDQEGNDRAPRGKTSSQFLRGIYADLLGRTPQAYDFAVSVNGTPAATFHLDEQAQLTNVLEGLGDSLPLRNLLVNGILHGAEATVPDKASIANPRDYITQQFTRLLGREPNVYELESFANAWATDPAVGPRSVIRAIVGSREYQSE